MTQQQTRYQSWAKVGLCVLMVGVSMALAGTACVAAARFRK